MKKLRIDSEIIEFLQGRNSVLGVGGKHYTDFIPLADIEYPQIVKKLKHFLP